MRVQDAVSNFTRDNEGRLIGQRTTHGSRHHYLFDGLDSVVAFVARDGTVQNSYRYDPFGGKFAETEPLFNPWQFASGYDRQSGLVHFGERYLDTKTGRWTQQDPLNQIADVRQANRYLYVGQDPVNRTDPSGLWFGEDVVDWVDDNISYTADEAQGNALGWAAGAGLCTVAVGTLGPLGAATTCAAGSAINTGDTVNDLLDYP